MDDENCGFSFISLIPAIVLTGMFIYLLARFIK